MIRSKDVLSAAHIFAICIILVLSLSIITYPIGFLARADIATSSTGTGTSGYHIIRESIGCRLFGLFMWRWDDGE